MFTEQVSLKWRKFLFSKYFYFLSMDLLDYLLDFVEDNKKNQEHEPD